VKVTYDSEVDVLQVELSRTPVAESDENRPGVIIDYDKDGNPVGIEILDASSRMENPRSMEYAIAGDSTDQLAIARDRPDKKESDE